MKTFEGRGHCLENRISLRACKLPWDFSMPLKMAGQHEPFLHQLPTPCLAAKQKASSNGVFPSSARGLTPLHWAGMKAHDATVERLLAAGADVNAVDQGGRGLGAGRVNPDFTQICRNLASEHHHFRKHLFKFIAIVVGCSGKGR